MTENVAEVAVFAEAEAVGALRERLEAILEAGESRVVLLDATWDVEAELAGLDPTLYPWLVAYELPLVFAFEGALRGRATELGLAADIRVCSSSGSLQGRLGSNSRVSTLAGQAAAFELFIGRAPLAAAQLLEMGLVSAVTAPGGALAEGRRIASVIASRGPIATRLGKEAIWRGLAQPLRQALRFETDLTLLLQTTKDRAEGVRAFLEKRPPKFTGE